MYFLFVIYIVDLMKNSVEFFIIINVVEGVGIVIDICFYVIFLIEVILEVLILFVLVNDDGLCDFFLDLVRVIEELEFIECSFLNNFDSI